MPGSMSQQLPLPYPVLGRPNTERSMATRSDCKATDVVNNTTSCRKATSQRAIQVIRQAMSQANTGSQHLLHVGGGQPGIQEQQPQKIAGSNCGLQHSLSSSGMSGKDDDADTATSPSTAGRPTPGTTTAPESAQQAAATQLEAVHVAGLGHQGNADSPYGAAAAAGGAQQMEHSMQVAASPTQQLQPMQLALDSMPEQSQSKQEASSPDEQQRLEPEPGPGGNAEPMVQGTLALERTNSGTTTVCSPLMARGTDLDDEMLLRSTEVLPMLLPHPDMEDATDAAPVRVASSSGAYPLPAASHSPTGGPSTRKRKQMDVKLSTELVLPCKMTVLDGTSRACSRASTPTSRDWCAAEVGAAAPLMALLGRAVSASGAPDCQIQQGWDMQGVDNGQGATGQIAGEADAVMLSQSVCEQQINGMPLPAGDADVETAGGVAHTDGGYSLSQPLSQRLRRGVSRSSPGYVLQDPQVPEGVQQTAAAGIQPTSSACGATHSACTSNASLIRHARALCINEHAASHGTGQVAEQPDGAKPRSGLSSPSGRVTAGQLEQQSKKARSSSDGAHADLCTAAGQGAAQGQSSCGALVLATVGAEADTNVGSHSRKQAVASTQHLASQQQLALAADAQQIVPAAVLHQITERVRKELSAEFEARVQAAVLHARQELEAGLLSRLKKKSKAKKQAQKGGAHKVVKEGSEHLKDSPTQQRRNVEGLQLEDLQAQLDRAQAQLRMLSEQQVKASVSTCTLPMPSAHGEPMVLAPESAAPPAPVQHPSFTADGAAVEEDMTGVSTHMDRALQGTLQDALHSEMQLDAAAAQQASCMHPLAQQQQQVQVQVQQGCGHQATGQEQTAMQVDDSAPAVVVAAGPLDTTPTVDLPDDGASSGVCVLGPAATLGQQQGTAAMNQMESLGNVPHGLSEADKAKDHLTAPHNPAVPSVDLQDAATQLLGWQLAHRHNPATPCNSDGSCPGSQAVTPTSLMECGSPVTGLLDSRTMEVNSTGTGKRRHGKSCLSTGMSAEHPNTGAKTSLPVGSVGATSVPASVAQMGPTSLTLTGQAAATPKPVLLDNGGAASAGALQNQSNRVARGLNFTAVLHSASSSPPSVHALFDGRLIVTSSDTPQSPDENAAAVPDLRPHMPAHGCSGVIPFQDATNLQPLPTSNLTAGMAQKTYAGLKQAMSPQYNLLRGAMAQQYTSPSPLHQPPLMVQQPVVTRVARDSNGTTTPSSTFGSISPPGTTGSPQAMTGSFEPRQLSNAFGSFSAPVNKGRFSITSSPAPQPASSGSMANAGVNVHRQVTAQKTGGWTVTGKVDSPTNSVATAKLNKANVMKAIEGAGRAGVTGPTLASQFALRGFPHSQECAQLRGHLQELVEDMDVYRKPTPGAKQTSMPTGIVDLSDASVCFAAM